MNKRTVGFSLDKKVFDLFSAYCKKNGMIASIQIENMIKDWLAERLQIDEVKFDNEESNVMAG